MDIFWNYTISFNYFFILYSPVQSNQFQPVQFDPVQSSPLYQKMMSNKYHKLHIYEMELTQGNRPVFMTITEEGPKLKMLMLHLIDLKIKISENSLETYIYLYL